MSTFLRPLIVAASIMLATSANATMMMEMVNSPETLAEFSNQDQGVMLMVPEIPIIENGIGLTENATFEGGRGSSNVDVVATHAHDGGFYIEKPKTPLLGVG